MKLSEMKSFSVRHRSQQRLPFLYEVALPMIDHLILGSGLRPFSQTYVDSVVLFVVFVIPFLEVYGAADVLLLFLPLDLCVVHDVELVLTVTF